MSNKEILREYYRGTGVNRGPKTPFILNQLQGRWVVENRVANKWYPVIISSNGVSRLLKCKWA